MTNPITIDATAETTTLEVVNSDPQYLIEKQATVRELQHLLHQSVLTHLEIGRRLAWLKENCPKGEFLRTLEDELGGLHRTTAWKLITFYQKCQQFPELRKALEGSFTKAVVLFQGLDDEALQSIEDGTHPITTDSIETWGTRQLRQEILDLRKQNKEIADTERARHRTEIESLEKQVGDLEGELAAARQETPEAKELKRMAGEISDLVSKLGKKVGELSRLPHTPDMDVPTRAAIEGQLATALRLAQGAHSRFIGLFVMDD